MFRFLPVLLVGLSLATAPVAVEAGNGKKIKRLLKKSLRKALRKPARRAAPQRRSRQAPAAAPSVVAPINRENRAIQSALNYFGFDAGTADGVLGRRSKSAISAYQGFLGLDATGALTDVGKDFLLTSHSRALNDPAATAQLVASSPHGVQGVLLAYRDGPVAMAAARSHGTGPEGGVADVPSGTAGLAAIPMARAHSPEGESLTEYCARIDSAAAANGGYVTPGAVNDPWLALGEQFCFARDDAIYGGDDLIARVQGMSEAEITAQCRGLGPILAPYVAALPEKPQRAVLIEVMDYANGTGMDLDQLATTSQICLAVGYRIDDAEVAMGSALMLASLGRPLFAELIGHHLSQGLGIARNADHARDWFEMALTALDGGAEPIFDSFNPGRAGVIRAALAMVAPVSGDGSTGKGVPEFALGD